MSISTPFRQWTIGGVGGISGGAGPLAATAASYRLTGSGHSIRDEPGVEYFAVPIDRVQMVHNHRLVPTTRFRHGRAIWAPANRVLVGGRIPRLTHIFGLSFIGGGPSYGLPISVGVSTPFHDSTTGTIHFSGATRRASDFSGEGYIIEIGGAILGLGGGSLQILVFDAPHNIFGGLESIAQRVQEAIHDYESSGGGLLAIFQNIFFESAIAFLFGRYSGGGAGATLYLGRFGGITETAAQ